MRYLRMFTNALAGGVLGATYLAVLALQLNPQVSLVSMTAVHWLLVFVGLYGFHLTVAFSLLMLVWDVVAMRPLSPAWLSVRLLAWFGTALAGAVAAITWANLKGFRAVLDDDAFERMRAGATVLTVSAALLLFLLVVRLSFGRRRGRPAGVLLVITLLASVLGPMWLRGAGGLPMPVVRRAGPAPSLLGDLARERPPGERAPHVRLILLDGASLGFIRVRVAAQSLPNFGRILDRGAVLDLATLKPTQAEPTWTAAATGKYPPKTGVRSDSVYRPNRGDLYPVDLLPDYCFAYALQYLGLVTRIDATVAALRARTLWEILSDFDIPSGIVRWPLTLPAHASRGYMISDGFEKGASSPLRTLDAQASAPIGAGEDARDVFDALQDLPWPDVLPATTPPASLVPEGLASVKWDRAYAEAASVLEQKYAPRLTALRYVGLNKMSYAFFRYAEPGLFGDVRPAEQQQYGAVLDRYYAYIDRQVGEAMNSLEPGDLLIVMSSFGMEAETLPKRLLAKLLGLSEQSGTHERAPDGFLLAWGSNVAQGELQRGSVVDLTPTVLYYMGLPVGRDMDGFVRSDLFQRAFTTEHSITYIATYER